MGAIIGLNIFQGTVTVTGGSGYQEGEEGTIYEVRTGSFVGNAIQIPTTNEFSLEQSTQAIFMIDLINQDTVSHSATVEVLNPDENLSVTLGQAGSILLAAGEIQTLLLDIDATFALPGIYDVQINAAKMVAQEERRRAADERKVLADEAKNAGKKALEKAGVADLDTGAAIAGGNEELRGSALIERGLRRRNV